MSEHGVTNSLPAGDPEFEARLNAYLDGEMSASETAEFEARIAADPRIREEVDSIRSIEASVRRSFTLPVAIDMPSPERLGKIEPKAVRVRPRWVRWGVGIAALLAIAVGVQQVVLNNGNDNATWVRGDAVLCMKALQEKWDKPEWVCKDDAEFAKYTKERFGQAWTIKPLEGLKLVGWTYTERLTNSNYASALMAEYQGKRIALVVDQKQFDRHVSIPADHSLYAHTKKCAQDQTIVMYELSPLDKPVLLERLKWEVEQAPRCAAALMEQKGCVLKNKQARLRAVLDGLGR